MQVALIDPSLFTWPYDRALAQGLQHGGADVRVYGPWNTDPEQNSPRVPYTPHFYRNIDQKATYGLRRHLTRVQKGLAHFSGLKGLASRLREDGANVVHFQWLTLPLVDAFGLKAFSGIGPLVLTLHDTDSHLLNPVQHAGMRHALQQFDRIIVHTGKALEAAPRLGAPPDRLRVVPHGLLLPPRPVRPPAPGRLRLLMFGKIQPYKGLDVLLQALGRLDAEILADLEIIVAGKAYMPVDDLVRMTEDPQYRQSLTYIPGYVSDEAMDQLFAEAHAVLMPYRGIDASGVMSIALAHAKPVIGSRIGGIAETFGGGRGALLVDPGDAGALANAIADYARDELMRRRLAEEVVHIRDAIPSWSEIGARTLALYQEVMGEARAPRGALA